MGWGIDWVSSGGSDFNRDLCFQRVLEVHAERRQVLGQAGGRARRRAS